MQQQIEMVVHPAVFWKSGCYSRDRLNSRYLVDGWSENVILPNARILGQVFLQPRYILFVF